MDNPERTGEFLEKYDLSKFIQEDINNSVRSVTNKKKGHMLGMKGVGEKSEWVIIIKIII